MCGPMDSCVCVWGGFDTMPNCGLCRDSMRDIPHFTSPENHRVPDSAFPLKNGLATQD